MSIRYRLMIILTALTVTVALIASVATLTVSKNAMNKNRIESIVNIAYTNGKALSEFISSDYGGEKGAISADFVNAFINNVRLGSTGVAFVLDENNTFLFHADQSLIGKRAYVPITVDDYRTGKLDAVSGSTDYMFDGHRRVMGYYIMQDAGWMFVVRQDYAEIISTARYIYAVSFAVLAVALILTVIASAVIASAFTKPIYKLNEAFVKATMGTERVLCDIKRSDEFGQLAKNYNIMISALDTSFNELQTALSQIKHLAIHDPMTGLVNRAGFDEKIAGSVAKGVAGGVFFFDLDNFKQINDVHGHDCGDKMLIEVSQRILRFDWIGAARIGGDEFVMLAKGTRGEMEDLAKALIEVMGAPVEIDGKAFAVSGSLGVAVLGGAPEDISKAMKRADEAMYRAKAKGKNTYYICDEK